MIPVVLLGRPSKRKTQPVARLSEREQQSIAKARTRQNELAQTEATKRAEVEKTCVDNITANPTCYNESRYQSVPDIFKNEAGNNLLQLAILTKNVALFDELLTKGHVILFYSLWNFAHRNHAGKTVYDLLKEMRQETNNSPEYQQFKKLYDAQFVRGFFINAGKKISVATDKFSCRNISCKR